MGLDLSSLNTKLDRAAQLWAELDSPRGGGPLYPEVTLRHEMVGNECHWIVERIEALHPMFPAVLGDCLHNYRSALDHLVSAVLVAEGLPANRRSQWPVTLIEVDWTKAPSGRQLDGLPERVVGEIRRWQPFVMQAAKPDIDVLHHLSELDNTDKHRRLNVVVVKPRAVETVSTAGAAGLLDWEMGPIDVGTVVGRHETGSGIQQVALHAEVAVDEPPATWRVGELLWIIDERVRQVVEAVATSYDGLTIDRSSGPPGGPSGYPYSQTNLFDPTSRGWPLEEW